MEQQRGQWGSTFGFLMAAVGSAVGLGNIWGFPYKMGANGGFAFLIVYLILAIVIGFPIMLSELAIGRKVGRSVLVSYQNVAGKAGTFIGWLAMLSPFLILSFYTVLGAYCVEYVVLNAGALFGMTNVNAVSGADTFVNVITGQGSALLFTAIFIAACYLIIRGGIKDGIESFNKIGMPALAIMLAITIVRAVTLPGAVEGLKFVFVPNLEPLKTNLLGVLSAAGGQMFFSLSLAMGVMVTYGSYLSKKDNLVKNSLLIIFSDTCVAIMAGLAVLPAAFALGGENAAMAGPKLLFITLQDVFNAMGAIGPIFGIIFYLLVVLAAITSAISLVEVLVTFFMDNMALKGKTGNRSMIVAIVCLVVMVEAALVALDGLGSNGLWIPFNETGLALGGSWLDFMDFISEGVFMPLGAMIMALLVGWYIGPETIREEVQSSGIRLDGALYSFFKICIRFLSPLGMAFILYGQVMSFL